MLPFFFAQGRSSLNPMPLSQATAATRRRRVLRDKNGVTAKRGLPAIVRQDCGRKSASDEFMRVIDDFSQALVT